MSVQVLDVEWEGAGVSPGMQTHDEAENAGVGMLLIREIAFSDAEAVAQLCVELGYPVSTEIMNQRIAAVQAVPDHVVYVACLGEAVVAWIDIGIVQHLQTEKHGEIGGFVVSNAYRSRGIGQKLLAQAERWVAGKGIREIVVRSRITRESAHRFYLREGYSRTKTSAVFQKNLESWWARRDSNPRPPACEVLKRPQLSDDKDPS